MPFSTAMKLALAAFLTVFAAAPASAKMWVDNECSRVLVTADNKWLIQEPGKPLVTCQVKEWPTNTPVAQIACDSGDSAKMEMVNDTTVIWNGVELNAYDGPLPCGATGTEWPD